MLRTLAALLAALVVFAATIAVALFVTPYFLGALTHCFPPRGSCGDGVGWAMLISSPISVPLTLIVAAALAKITYARVNRRSVVAKQIRKP